MATIVRKEFPNIGKGFSISTQIIPPIGLLSIIKEISYDGLYRLSKDGGKTYSEWEQFSFNGESNISSLKESCDLIFDYVVERFSGSTLILDKREKLSTTYDKTIFKMFFDSDDEGVLSWSVNVLEKLFSSGVVPMYIKRDNSEDYNSFFLSVTQFFAYIVLFSRQFRNIENSDILMKEFIEGWGLVYENIDSLEKRQYLFKNWKNEFEKRGTYLVTSDGVINSELKRLVGYEKPNEFIFAALSPQDIGWCLGWSSPTWYGTETVNAVSKGFDYGIDYTGENYGNFMSFGKNEITLDKEGTPVSNQLITIHDWEIQVNEGDLPHQFFEDKTVGVNPIESYPIVGDVVAEYSDDIYTLRPSGEGISGVSSEIDKDKLIEVYVGLDYEITVWIKADSDELQNIDFGVECYDYNKEKVKLVRITDFRDSNSFFDSENKFNNPCKVPGIYYRLRGIIYNISTEKQPEYYLNFENGRPLRFMNNVKYISPYIVQNREGSVSNIHIAGVSVKPINLPFSQGYLGHKNVIAMYSTIKTPRTKKDIESFIKKYLVSYKNIVSYTWLDWVIRTSWFLTFILRRSFDNKLISGGVVSLEGGTSAITDEDGYCRFELPFDSSVNWVAEAKGVAKSGSLVLKKDTTVDVYLDIPLDVIIQIIKPGWGDVSIEGDTFPYSEIILTATPKEGYTFIKWVYEDGSEDSRNPTNYWLSDKDITVQAIFERESLISFTPSELHISPDENIGLTQLISTKKWEIDNIDEDWVNVTPTSGEEGENTIQVNVTE